VISLAIMATVLLPAQTHWLTRKACAVAGFSYGPPAARAEVLFAYVWLAASMAVAYLAKLVERDRGPGKHLSVALITWPDTDRCSAPSRWPPT